MRHRERSEKPAFPASLRLRRGEFASPLELFTDRERKDVSNARTCAAHAASCSAKPSTTPAAATNVLALTVPLYLGALNYRAFRLLRRYVRTQTPGADNRATADR
jgi:hypothetical protein